MLNDVGHILFAIGVCFLAALIIGRLSALARIPRVTGYLVVGIIAGPSLSRLMGYPVLIDNHILGFVTIISDVALAFIMLTIGSQFKFLSLRRWGKRLAILSASEIIVSFLFVAIIIFLFNLFVNKTIINTSTSLIRSSVYFAIFTGIIAAATAPAASLMVIREYESDGPVTDIVLALIGLNNFVSILVFNIVTHFLLNSETSTLFFIIKLAGPILVGFFIGMLISIWAQNIENQVEYLILLTGALVANIGLCWLWQLDIFLSSFITGMTLINASPKATVLFESLKKVDYPLYVMFFVIAGASLHIEILAHIGLLGIAYIIMRTMGKVFGNWLGAKLGDFGYIERRWLGYAMIAQAGVAIGLSQSLAKSWPAGGSIIQTIILGSVVFFELVGPITVRQALVHAGEVPLLTLLAKKAKEGTYEGFHHVIEQFRASLGIPVGHNVQSAADILVKYVMRKNVDTICEDMPFNEILHQLSHSKYDRFPIINKDKQFIGVIDYSDIRGILFDEAIARFVVARDLVKPEPLALHPDQTLGEVLNIFKNNSDVTYLPIVDDKNSSLLVGIISQNEVLAAFRKMKLKNELKTNI
ncbi:CBS domain-containing protein [candidate division KSB1 bacterium]|nr:CBS domain-containing protein [candidate division KSB1 bacterium]